MEAAGLVVLWKKDCQTCDGSGYGGNHGHVYNNDAEMDGTAEHQCVQCPVRCDVCGGRSWNPTAQAIELQAEAFYDDDDSYPEKWEHQIEDVKDWYRQKSRVGLVAVLSMGDTE